MVDETLTKQFGIGEDAGRNTTGLSAYLANARTNPEIVRRAAEIHDQLRPVPGGRYLEVGCGSGEDARSLAARIGPSGSVVGLDISDSIVEEARAKGVPDGVEFVTGDAHTLQFADGEFDGISAYRVFMHLLNPEAALIEFMRVTKAGGRIAIREPDWLTLVIDGPGGSVDRRIQDHIRYKIVRHPDIGHRLPNMFSRAGVIDLHVSASALLITDFEFGRKLLDLENKVNESVEEGVVTKEEGDEWIASFQSEAEKGKFFACMTGFLVAATKS